MTSAHDTSEVGLIPITVSPDSTGYISAVIEVLCRETHKAVLPVYYDSSIKMKYTRDQNSVQMLDIIHDNIGDSFPLAWSNELDAILLQGTFYNLPDSASPTAVLPSLLDLRTILLKRNQIPRRTVAEF